MPEKWDFGFLFTGPSRVFLKGLLLFAGRKKRRLALLLEVVYTGGEKVLFFFPGDVLSQVDAGSFRMAHFT